MPINAERGTIYSEDGKMLCTSIPIYDVRIDFMAEGLRAKNSQVFKDKLDSLGMALAALFNDKTTEEYKNELKLGYDNGERYYLLKKAISYEQYNQIRKFPLVKLGKNKSGFMFEVYNRRLNPYQMLGFRTIGLVKKDSNYNVGLERYYETTLRGQKGIEYILKDNLGRRVGKWKEGKLDSFAIQGSDLQSTIDLGLQGLAEKLLKGKIGSVVAIEPSTGEIMAMVTSPNFDPEQMVISKKRGDFIAALSHDSLKPLFDRSVSAEYPPGFPDRASRA